MMKPKKGETNAEMDEPMKNPLHLVKELVLLIVEARTPDLSVKGRAEGPHCPVIRGRPAHKCSSEKSECVRATEFCHSAQRLWLNSIPICLDILLFPYCIHGQEEASVTEGTVTKLSHENALLIERWIIDGNKRRQDDCLSSSMLIQAVRSYLHFSQISSWLYSTGGNLPGLLAYRVYAPGEATSLDFPQAPDIHSFPVCLASFHHIRVRVSSLQRQASVPILACLQDQTKGNGSKEALYRNDSLQKYQSRAVKVMTEYGHLRDLPSSENSSIGNLYASGMSKKAHPPTSSNNTLTKKLKGGKKSMKSLQDVSALILYEKEMYQNYPSLAGAGLLPSNTYSGTENTFSTYGGTVNRHTLSDTDILARKARNRTKMKTTDGKDYSRSSGDVLYATSIDEDRDPTAEDANVEAFLDIQMNPSLNTMMFSPHLPGREIKSAGLKKSQNLLNQMVVQEAKNKAPFVDIFQDDNNKRRDSMSEDIKRHVRGIKKAEENSFCIEQMKTDLNMEMLERKPAIPIGAEDECRQTDKEVDLQTLIRRKKKTEYYKFKKSLFEGQPDLKANLEMWWPLQVQGMRQPPLNLSKNSTIYNSDMRKLSFPLSPKEKFYDDSSKDVSTFNINTSNESKMLARKKNHISQKEASEEEFIRILSDRLSVVNSSPQEISASPKFSAKFHDTEHFTDSMAICKNLTQQKVKSHPKKKWPHSKMTQDDTKSVGLDSVRDEVASRSVNSFLAQNSNLPELSINVSSMSSEDSDDTPVASPIQEKPVSESLIKLVADKSAKRSCHWLQSNRSNTLCNQTPLVVTASMNISDSELTAGKDLRFVAHEIIQGQGFDNSLQTDRKQVNGKITEAQTVTEPLPDSQVEFGETGLDQFVCKTKLDNSYTQFLNKEICLNRNSHASEDPMVEDHISSYQDIPQPGSRKMFEENLLPLVSYDAGSDSFKKVEELYNSNILHSPKVLFSCDVPSTKTTTSRKCINFGDIFEAEFFKAKISDMVDPEAIGKYMSNLAILSSSFTNGQEDQELGTVKQVEDLLEMSSITECLLQPRREVQDLQESADTTYAQDYNLSKENDNEHVRKEKQNEKLQENLDATVDELDDDYNFNKCSANKDSFNKAKRKLHLNNFDNSQRKTKELEGVTRVAANVSLSLPDGAIHEQNAQQEEDNQRRTHYKFMTSEKISASFPSDTVSPQLSSSCSSSSSSSTSSVRKVSSSLSPTFPTALRRSPAYKQETFRNGSEEDICVLDIQDSLSTYVSNVTSERNSLEQEDGDTSTSPAGETCLYKKLQSYLKSNWRSSSNKESLTFTNSTFSQSSTSQSPTTSSLHSTSISAHPLQSAVLLSQQMSLEAAHNNLCHNDKSSTTSLSMVVITQPSPHEGSHFDNRSCLKLEPPHNSSCGFQHNISDLHYDQNALIYNDLDSQKDCHSESSHCVPKLFQDWPEVKHVIDSESTSCDQADRTFTARKGSVPASSRFEQEADRIFTGRQGNVPASSRYVNEADSQKEMLKCAQTGRDILSRAEKAVHKSIQENLIGTLDIAKPSCDSLQNQIRAKTEGVEICHNCSHFSDKDLNFEDSPTTSNSFSSVTSTETDITETSLVVSAGNDCDNKNADIFRHEHNNSVVCGPNCDSDISCNMRVIADSLEKVALNCKNNNTSQTINPLAKTNVYEDSNLLQEHSDSSLEIEESCSSLRDLNSRTRSQIKEEFDEMFSTSSLEKQVSNCTTSIDLETSESSDGNKNSDMYLGRGQCKDEQDESMHKQFPSTKIIQPRQHSQNGFEVQCLHTANEMEDDASDWNNDVVFYISESESKVKGDCHTSLLSNSLMKHVPSSENYKATRPSSLSAEVNLEMRLRSNPCIGNKSNLDFSSHSRSPPFHGDPPGWSSVPPHRTVSTPSCMDRESSSKDENSISNISVIQQQYCDNVSHTGLRKMAAKSASMIFNNRTGLPTQSSPAPLKRKSGGKFDYDVSLLNTRAIKNAFSCSKLASNVDDDNEEEKRRTLSTSAPASTNCLLGNFEESILNGRIDPVGTVDGFTAEIGASGAFCPKHLHLPVSAFFFALSDDNAPSPYLGHINLESVGKKGYHIPKKGTVQVTLFNPSKTVVKMFVVVYDLSDMPASSQTFIRQRTVYCPIDKNHTAPSYLRYLIHLRCASSQSGKIYLHTDIRLIFARHKFDIDAKTIPYELKSYTEGPHNPKYSPKK